VRLLPEETRRNSGLCPVCRKPVTVGVLNRVHELADRPTGTKPAKAASFSSFVPLAEILSEILQAGPASKTVGKIYEDLLARFGPELFILEQAPLDDIRRVGSSLLAEAIQRMREKRVIREAGYDGEYGVIRLFQRGELKKLAERSHVFDFGEAGPPAVEKLTVQGSTFVKDAAGPEALALPSAMDSNKGRTAVSSPCRLIKRLDNRELGTLNPEPSGLDPDQQAAVEIAEGPLLIIAGPGTGKTRTLTNRIVRLITEYGVLPDQCLAITFTRRAAGEMQARLQQLVPDKAALIPVMTFHSLGLLMLKEQINFSDLPPGFRVAGDNERAQLLRECLKISSRKAECLLAEISRYKRARTVNTSAGDTINSLKVYEQEMRKRSLVDFDDLIAMPLKMLETYAEIAAFYRERYRWISVDEYQDIDQEQYRLLKLLVPPGGNLCVIGDPDQAIYGFRGSDAGIFNRFMEDFPGAAIIQLKRNYRSGKMIVLASQQVIASASPLKDRRIQPLSDNPAKIIIHASASDSAEAEFVVHTIEQMIGGSTFFSFDSGRVSAAEAKSYSFADFAVLCRTNAQTDLIRAALIRSGMPFWKCAHTCLADSPLVLKIVDLMKKHTKSAKIVPSTSGSHFGKCDPAPNQPGKQFRPWQTDSSLLQCFDKALLELDEAERQEALILARLLRPLAERSADIESFLSELALGVEVDLWDPRADSISLLTMHAAKGLEFPVVFITGCEDGIIPLHWGDFNDCDINEEKRLFFVGMTRAKDRLFLCHAKRRRWMGMVREMTPSPFLRDIEEQLLERSKTLFQKKKPSGPDQLALF
jgi:superfamily I DNA/RNA helicase